MINLRLCLLAILQTIVTINFSRFVQLPFNKTIEVHRFIVISIDYRSSQVSIERWSLIWNVSNKIAGPFLLQLLVVNHRRCRNLNCWFLLNAFMTSFAQLTPTKHTLAQKPFSLHKLILFVPLWWLISRREEHANARTHGLEQPGKGIHLCWSRYQSSAKN